MLKNSELKWNEVQQEVEKNPDQLIPDFDEVVQAWLPKQNIGGTTDNNVIKQKEK